MRRARTVACPSCHARWDADQARFCGWCGVALRRTAVPDGEVREPRQWPRRLVWTGGVLAGVAVLATVALLADGLRLPRSRPDRAVELADDGDAVVAQGEPLSREERAELLAPFDPNRLRCEPEGCEVWRRDLTDRQGLHTNVVAFGGLVVVNVGNDVTAYDAASGEERWRQRWPAESARAAANWTTILGGEDGEVVVLSRPERGDLLALRRDGSVAWRDAAAGQIHNLQVAGDTLLTSSLRLPAEPGAIGEAGASTENVRARDLASGAIRWERAATSLVNVSDRVVLAREPDGVVVLDLASGTELARRDLGPDPWLYPVGAVLLSYGPDDEQALLSTDLEPLPGLDDLSELYPLEGAEQILALRNGRTEADGTATPDQLLLVGGDGRIRWSVDLATTTPGTARLCCPQPQVRDGVLLLPAFGGRDDWTALSLADGGPVDAPAGIATPPGDQVWWVSSDTALEQRTDRIVLHHDGAQVEVGGQNSWLLSMQPPFVFTDGRSLLGVQPVPQD